MSEPGASQILIVDDARDIRDPLGQYLRKQGFRTRLAADATGAREILASSQIHLVVLDIMMPGEDGLSLCRWLQQIDGPPVILLTALADETDRIVGLELGADDYLVKPFNPRELLARIRAILRRMPAAPAAANLAQRQFGPWRFDAGLMMLHHRDGREIELTTAETRLLSVMLDHSGEVLSRSSLLDITAGRDAKAYDRAIDNHISRLRRKIEEDPKKPEIILTEWGGGYRLAATVTEVET